jgi:hypothetical protein
VQLLVSDARGASFPEVMKRTVLDPVGMNRSSFEPPASPARASLAASGHDLAGGALPERWCVYPELAAAGLWTTATDWVSNSTAPAPAPARLSRIVDRMPSRLELFPESEYTYFMREKEALVTFQKNGDGPINEITFLDGRPRTGVRAKP